MLAFIKPIVTNIFNRVNKIGHLFKYKKQFEMGFYTIPPSFNILG